MVVSDASIHNIMGGMESTAGVRLHNHRRKLKQRFDIIKKLGQGTYGKVQLGINKETGQEVAIKTIKKAKIETEADLVRIRREIQIMSSVQHPNIIHIYEVFENREKMVLVMEYAAGGELYDFLSEKKVLAEEEARRIFRQIATAVYYCHKHKICHRDLKLENILLDEHGSAKIADFGLSNVFNEQRLLNTFCGSPLYASPEIVKGTPYHGPEVDCWSLGVLLYTLVYGAMPFDGSNFKRLVKQISQGDYFEPKKPSPASPLIREMLTVTPARRANIEKICAHWWVNEGHTESCLDIAEELANQTPVRLDLLLSLAPPPPAVGSEMLLTDEQGAGDSRATPSDSSVPTRCHSVGSLMELDQPSAEMKLKEFERQKRKGSVGDGPTILKDAPKRKLEEGVSTEDAARGGAKKKEWSRKQDSDQSMDSHSIETSKNQEKPVSDKTAEEKMDVDVDVTVTLKTESHTDNRESIKQGTQPAEVPSSSADAPPVEAAAQKTAEKEATKTTLGRDKTTRKSVKGSAKKSKPGSATSAENLSPTTKVIENKETEVSSKDDKVEASVVDSIEEKTVSQPVLSNEGNKEKEGAEGPVVESVKLKVKKKKKVIGSKAEDETADSQKHDGDIGTGDSSLQSTAAESKPDEHSSQDNKEVNEPKKSEVKSSEISNNVESSSKDSNVVKTDVPKMGTVKTKKSRGDLSLGKLGASSDKLSGSEDLASPTKPVERRRSKIFENSDQFNIFLRGSTEPKSPVGDKPKKVFIPGVKVSDYKQAFERRSSVTSPSPIKNSSSKKTVDPTSKSPAPKSNSCDTTETPEGEKISEVTNLNMDSELNSSDKVQEDLSSIVNNNVQSSSDDNTDALPAPKSKELSSNTSKTETTNNVVNETAEMRQTSKAKEDDNDLKLVPALQVTDKMSQQEKARIKKLKDAVDIISNAIAEETKRESSETTPVRKISSSKPPVPGSFEKSRLKGAVNSSASIKSPPLSPSEKKTAPAELQNQQSSEMGAQEPEKKDKFSFEDKVTGETVHRESDTAAPKKDESDTDKSTPTKKKSNKVEITLKSATLPRRRTSKAEIQLGYPPSKIPETATPGEYRTEVEHMVGSTTPSRLQTQRSEVAFPVAAATNVQPLSVRSSSLEPEGTKNKQKPREHIIPIQLEQEKEEGSRPPQPARPPVPPLQQQRSIPQRASSLSRQSTQDSDTDSTISVSGPEPIRKSPREYIIPIAVEGGGYVTPRAGSLEPSVSEASTEPSKHHRRSSSRSRRLRKMGSLLSDSEDEGFNSPYATLQRHSSVGRDSENPDEERPFHHMHRLRSSKPRRATLEHNDSLSSAEEEDDDDDGFEILTAESLFSTLLSRVRSLTQRLNVEDGARSGFPSSRLMSHLAASGRSSPSSGFWSNMYGFPGEPLSRRVSESSQFSRPYGHNAEGPTPWRRSASRDVSDGDSVFSEADGGTLPRGSSSSRFDCGSLSDDAGIDSPSSYYYTPSLAARRMQHPWRSASQTLGTSSPTISDPDWPANRDFLSSRRKTSLGSLSSQNTSIPQQHSSRRLGRTLSLHSRGDERSNRDTQGSHVPDYGRSHSIRSDHHSSARRSLSSLDSKENRSLTGVSAHRGSSVSDFSDYSVGSRASNTERVLPPLPFTAASRDKRREPSKIMPYSRHNSSGASIGSHSSAQHLKENEETVHSRPHHSSSLPTISRVKAKKPPDMGKIHEKTSKETKPYATNTEVESSSPGKFSSRTSVGVSNSEIKSVREKENKQSISESDKRQLSSSASREQSKIPSLLHLRSSSVTRDPQKNKSQDKTSESNGSSAVVKRSQSISSSTPDRSILSKFFRQGSEEKEVSKGENNGDDSSKKKRRISRFLRPDFFDTPREESIYAKKKDAQKAAETENLKKINDSKSDKIASPEEQAQISAENKFSNSNNGNKAIGDTALSGADSISKTVTKEPKKDVKASKKLNGKQTKSADDKKQNSSVKNDNKKVGESSPVFEKQASNSGNKSGFLLSLEKKLEKFKSSGDDVPSTSTAGKSRVDKAIRSLREQSIHRSEDIVTTESHLLKRAVSVDDCCSMESGSRSQTLPKESSSSKLGSKVNSVLGLFRKLEDSPPKMRQSPPQTSALTRLRRTQSVYAGSQSDSVLLDSNDNKPVPPQRLKKTTSNSSVAGGKQENSPRKVEVKVSSSEEKNSTVGELPISTATKNVVCNDKTAESSAVPEDNKQTVSECLEKGKSVSKPVKKDINKPKIKANQVTNKTPSQEQTNLTLSVQDSIIRSPDTGTSDSNPVTVISPTCINTDLSNSHEVKDLKMPQNSIVTSESNSANSTELNLNLSHHTKTSNPASYISENVTEVKENGIEGQGGLIFVADGNAMKEDNKEINQSPTEDFSLNDDEIKFANVKRLDSCLYPGDECSVASPADESESFDSWSVCSDFEGREFPTSPIPPLGDDVEESVVDRIRRKSFYSRFNDVKKKRKSSLSSIGSLSSSYRDPSSLSSSRHPQGYSRKTDYLSDYNLSPSHHKSHHKKPSRSQSLYSQSDYDSRLSSFNRKSPIPLRTQLSSPAEINSYHTGNENEVCDLNGSIGSETDLRDSSQKTVSHGIDIPSKHSLGGSMETLRLPRHFTSNVNLGSSYHIPTYSGPVRRASDSHLSRSIDSNIGTIIPKSYLPVSTLGSRLPGGVINSALRAVETLPNRGKYNRLNSHNTMDLPSSLHGASEEEFERPLSPR